VVARCASSGRQGKKNLAALADDAFDELRQIPNLERIDEFAFSGQFCAVLQLHRAFPQEDSVGVGARKFDHLSGEGVQAGGGFFAQALALQEADDGAGAVHVVPVGGDPGPFGRVRASLDGLGQLQVSDAPVVIGDAQAGFGGFVAAALVVVGHAEDALAFAGAPPRDDDGFAGVDAADDDIGAAVEEGVDFGGGVERDAGDVEPEADPGDGEGQVVGGQAAIGLVAVARAQVSGGHEAVRSSADRPR